MSRNINSGNTYEAPIAEYRSSCLVITEVKGHMMALYLDQNRLKGATVLHLQKDASHIGDVFTGRISKIVKNANGCFVEYEKGINGYLPIKEMAFFQGKEGDLLPVQLVKEPIKTKPATLSNQISLQGDYFVLTYEDSSGVGVSKKLSSTKRQEILEWMKKLEFDAKIGVIVRTQAEELSQQDFCSAFQSQVEELLHLVNRAYHGTAFSKIYTNDSIVNELRRVIKANECNKVVTDSLEVYNALNEANKSLQWEVKFYEDASFSLVKLYKLDSLLSEALQNRVWMKSGANIIIEQLESLTAIDVNSGKGLTHKSKDSHSHRLEVNMEAAKEIALQLRLRNITGMIIIDFINLDQVEERNELMRVMKEYTAQDIVPVSVIDYTALGLMELTRKKGMKSLREQMYETTEI